MKNKYCVIKIINIVVLMSVLVSCSKKRKEYYKNGMIKKEYTLKQGKIEGEYKEFFKNGDIRLIHQYKDEKKTDSSIYYYKDVSKIKFIRYWYSNRKIKELNFDKNGKITSEGPITKDILREGLWNYYNDKEQLISKSEYKIINKREYLNQSWDFNKVGDTLYNSGNFYDLRIVNDTINIGEPIKIAAYLDVPLFRHKESEILVCIPFRENINFNKDFSNDGKIKLDTFYNLTIDVKNQIIFPNTNFNRIVAFGKYYYTSGDKLLRGYILEYYTQEPTEKDSLIRKERKMYFEIPLYVKDIKVP